MHSPAAGSVDPPAETDGSPPRALPVDVSPEPEGDPSSQTFRSAYSQSPTSFRQEHTHVTSFRPSERVRGDLEAALDEPLLEVPSAGNSLHEFTVEAPPTVPAAEGEVQATSSSSDQEAPRAQTSRNPSFGSVSRRAGALSVSFSQQPPLRSRLSTASRLGVNRLPSQDTVLTSFTPADEPPKHTIAELQTSWSFFFLRILNAWLFFLAAVVLAGIALNSFLNLFVSFYTETISGSTGIMDSAKRIVKTLVVALLFVSFFAGLVERAVWLILDSLAEDPYLNYRRTLCLEGSGPGTFVVTQKRIELHRSGPATPGGEEGLLDPQVGKLISALRKNCSLRQDVLLKTGAGCTTSVVLPRNSVLLADGAMKGFGEEGDKPKDSVEFLMEQPLPMTLVFLVENRKADFEAPRWSTEYTRAVVDHVVQWLIYLTLNLLPWIWAAFNATVPEDGPQEIISGVASWFLFKAIATATDKGVQVAIVHTLVYYLSSVFMDYYTKCATLMALLELRRSGRRRTATRAELEACIGAQPGFIRTYRQNEAGKTDSLNAWVRLRELQSMWEFQAGLLGLSIAGIVAGGLLIYRGSAGTAGVILVASVVLLALGLQFCIKTCTRNRAFSNVRSWAGLTRENGAVRDTDTRNADLALWFRVNCGVDELRCAFASAAGFIVFGVVAFLICSLTDHSYRGTFYLSTMLTIWFLVLFIVSVCIPKILWIFTLVQLIVLCITTCVAMFFLGGLWSLLYVIVLLVLTQAAMGRERNSPTRSVMIIFFLITIALIASLMIYSAYSSTGGVLTAMFGMDDDGSSLPWCLPNETTCIEYAFPVNGLDPYGFCSLSWPLGSEKKDASPTVSTRCNDTSLCTSLEVIDFGHMSKIAYTIGNNVTMNAAVATMLPGWTTVHFQDYDPARNHYTAFMHLKRENTSVVAVRGTWSTFEVVQDLNIWMPAGFIGFAGSLGPKLYDTRSLLEFIEHFARATTKVIADASRATSGDFFQDLLNYTQGVKQNFPQDTVYLTGHSLGGGLASIVGARLNVSAITFSAPGLEATSAILNTPPTIDRLRHFGVNVQPAGDPVPKIDTQTGTSLRIDCGYEDTTPPLCHDLDSTLCELLASCGDRGRGYYRQCSACAGSGQSRLLPECQRSTPASFQTLQVRRK